MQSLQTLNNLHPVATVLSQLLQIVYKSVAVRTARQLPANSFNWLFEQYYTLHCVLFAEKKRTSERKNHVTVMLPTFIMSAPCQNVSMYLTDVQLIGVLDRRVSSRRASSLFAST